MKKILENQHEVRIERENNALNDERLTQTLQTELGKGQYPYSRQWKSWYMGAVIFGFIGGALSFSTEVFAFAWLTYFDPLPKYVAVIVAGIIAVALAALIEWLKRGANDSFFFVLVFRRKFDGFNFVKMVFIMCISVSASFYACTLIPKAAAKVTAAQVDLIDMDSIKNDYAARISTQLAAVNLFTEEKKSSFANKAQAELNAMHTAKDSAIVRAERENSSRTAAALADGTAWGWTIGFFSLGLELLFVLAYWYSKNYLYKSALERDMLADEKTPTEPVNTNPVVTQFVPPNDDEAEQAPKAEARRPIGFEMPTVNVPIIDKTETTTHFVNTQSVGNMVSCAHCEQGFEKRTTFHKYCSDKCRIEANEKRTGKTLKIVKKS